MPKHTDKQKSVAIYARCASGFADDQTVQIERQLKAMRAHCASHHYVIAGEYIDAGASGLDDQRPHFTKMMANALSPERPFDAVVVEAMSRFSRNMAASERWRDALQRHGVELVTVDRANMEPIDEKEFHACLMHFGACMESPAYRRN